MPSENDAVAAIREAACGELAAASKKIHHCLAQLTDEQVWWRPADGMNAIGNLLLHLCGNVRQWIIAGVGGAEDVRRRWEEFEQRTPIAKAELLARLDATVAEAVDVIHALSADALSRKRRIQSYDVTATKAIFDSIAHFRGHTQEIVHMTRCQLGNAYQFDFVPQNREQGRE
jgi:uncharacterized damage-inducible protein DinB